MGFFSRGHCGTWAFVKLTNPHATERTKCRGWGSGRRFCEVERVGFLLSEQVENIGLLFAGLLL